MQQQHHHQAPPSSHSSDSIMLPVYHPSHPDHVHHRAHSGLLSAPGELVHHAASTLGAAYRQPHPAWRRYSQLTLQVGLTPLNL